MTNTLECQNIKSCNNQAIFEQKQDIGILTSSPCFWMKVSDLKSWIGENIVMRKKMIFLTHAWEPGLMWSRHHSVSWWDGRTWKELWKQQQQQFSCEKRKGNPLRWQLHDDQNVVVASTPHSTSYFHMANWQKCSSKDIKKNLLFEENRVWCKKIYKNGDFDQIISLVHFVLI